MRNVLFALGIPLILVTSAVSIQAASTTGDADICTYPQRTPIENQDGLLTVFVDPTCGEYYEAGYRLEGNTLHFPMGGAHEIQDASPEEAHEVLRQAYGLVGDNPDELVRTKF